VYFSVPDDMGDFVDNVVLPAGSPEEEVRASIVARDDGVWLRADASRQDLQAAAGHVFAAGSRFAGLDYALFLHRLYGTGPALPAAPHGQPLLRMADAIVPFPGERRALYRSVKIDGGEAEYVFEPVYLDAGGDALQPATLAFDEFVAAMWATGIRFGIDAAAVRQGMASARPGRRVVARRLDPVPGRDAAIVEVSEHLHRSNAPREQADGRVHLDTFENRFPQVPAHARLLRKEPRTEGARGIELSGVPIETVPGRDLELTGVAGRGTMIVHEDGHDYLVSAIEGFINVDRTNGRLSVGPKIVGSEGVSVRTTGNLQLAGAYEEFGELQENRVVEGGDITIHGDVFGHIASRGGTVQLGRNLMGGSVANAAGAVHVAGVASNAVVQAKGGEVTIRQAQNCIVTGTKVTIGEATNCEILADEVVIGIASGCAIAGRRMTLTCAGPRKGSEMLLFAVVPDTACHDDAIAGLEARAQRVEATVLEHRNAVGELTGRKEVRSYLALAACVRAGHVTLTAAQQGLLRKMAEQVAPALGEVSRLSLAVNAAQAQLAQLQQLLNKARQRRSEVAVSASCKVRVLEGETVLRTMAYQPDAGPPHDLAPKEIRARLRAGSWNHAPVLLASVGSVDWTSG
jgi:hypothetical protein